jgi:hypothetical protein
MRSMKLARGVPASLLPALTLAAALAACAGRASSGVQAGTGGSKGSSCNNHPCPIPIPTSLVLAVEIDPPASSLTAGTAGLTEIPSKDLNQSNGPVRLVADPLVAVTATFNASSNAPVPSTAQIELDVPSVIPGRPDLVFQTSASSAGSSSAATAQLSIPQTPVMNMERGTLSLVPLPPSDQQSPPYSAPPLKCNGMDGGCTLDPKTPQLAVDLPSDNFSISGALTGALNGADTFVVRAYQGGIQVSNAPVTTSDGSSFFLAIPSAVAAAGGQVTVQISPQSPNDAQFVFDPFTVPNPPPTNLSLGTASLAPYQKPNQFNLSVVTNDAAQTPVGAALVQIQTNLGSSSSSGQSYPGSTQFARSATTNAQGIASLSLLPGTQDVTIKYTAVVIPPAGSPYATSCSLVSVNKAGATGVSTPSAPGIGPATVSKRAVVSGRVDDSSGHPVAGVAITATPGSEPVSACAGMTATTAAPASTTTDSQGNYSLFLDPGTADRPVTYQLDYDPPAGSSVPRFTESVLVSDDPSTLPPHNVPLPAGGLVEGLVTDASQPPNPLPSATVRLFQTQCSSYPGAQCSTPPQLRGQAITDSAGHFQIVVWLDP